MTAAVLTIHSVDVVSIAGSLASHRTDYVAVTVRPRGVGAGARGVNASTALDHMPEKVVHTKSLDELAVRVRARP